MKVHLVVYLDTPQKCKRHPELDEPLHTELAAALQESEKTVHSRTLNYVMYVILHFESWLDILYLGG
jgi:hypothetical protein